MVIVVLLVVVVQCGTSGGVVLLQDVTPTSCGTVWYNVAAVWYSVVLVTTAGCYTDIFCFVVVRGASTGLMATTTDSITAIVFVW